MLRHVGMPDDLVDAWCDLHVNTTRTIRYGSTLGEPFPTSHGIGQGDPLSIVPAIILVSW